MLQKIVYDYTETTANEVSFTVNADRVVTAHYERQFAIVLEPWILALLAVVIAVSLFVAWRAAGATAKEVVEEYRERARRFVKRKR